MFAAHGGGAPSLELQAPARFAWDSRLSVSRFLVLIGQILGLRCTWAWPLWHEESYGPKGGGDWLCG